MVQPNSHLRYQGTTNILKGQTLAFTQIEIMVMYIPIAIVNVIHLELLGPPLIQVTIQANAIITLSPNNSEILGCLPGQILGLQT